MADLTNVIRVAQVKAVPVKGCGADNLRTLLAVLHDVAGQRPDVVVTPECFLDGYLAAEAGVTAACLRENGVDPATSEAVRAVAEWASRHAAWVVLGCLRLTAEGVFNSALILDRHGRLHGAYDKTHLQGIERQCLPGRDLPVFDADFGRFGVLICADRRWPETVRTLALRGARIIFNPTYGMHDERNLCLMRTRSYESEVFIAFTHPHQALLTDPTGQVRANEERREVAFAVTEVDLSEADRVRATAWAHLKDRRPELYEGHTSDRRNGQHPRASTRRPGR